MNLFITPKVINEEALSKNDGLMQINLSIYSKYFKGSYSKIKLLIFDQLLLFVGSVEFT